MRLGVLHPGAMGAVLAGAARVEAWWAAAGRSPETRRRAGEHGLVEAGSLSELVAQCDVLLSVVPPHAARSVAETVAAAGFDGIYVDANAIAPATTRQIGARFERFVDGGIVGPPPHRPGTTRLYLCGEEAQAVASLWADTGVDARVLAGSIGAASALKVAYAGWTKGSAALLLAMRRYAAATGVEDELVAEWARSIPDLPERADRTAAGVAPKAWRFVGEMEQIAAALADEGLLPGFHEAARDVYRTLAEGSWE